MCEGNGGKRWGRNHPAGRKRPVEVMAGGGGGSRLLSDSLFNKHRQKHTRTHTRTRSHSSGSCSHQLVEKRSTENPSLLTAGAKTCMASTLQRKLVQIHLTACNSAAVVAVANADHAFAEHLPLTGDIVGFESTSLPVPRFSVYQM